MLLNPVIVFLAISFWGWKLAGELLPVPLVMTLIRRDIASCWPRVGKFLAGETEAAAISVTFPK